MLNVEGLTVRYGGALILDRINVRVDEKQLVAVVGPNGAGKTTLLRAISGLVTSSGVAGAKLEGKITFEGKEIQRQKPDKVTKMGIIHCPERAHPFGEMTVDENLFLGAYLRKDKTEIRKDLEECFSLFPEIKERGDQRARTLSGGELQMLAIARSLMARPKLLIIDEPSTGLSPILRGKVFERIAEINKKGVTVLLVEQEISEIIDMSDKIYVFAHGEVAAEGTKEDLLKNKDIREIYLGL